MSTLLHPISDLLTLLQTDLTHSRGVIDPAGKDVHIARAPGRLDVMGGIADYTGSLVCEMPLDVAAAVAVQPRDDRQLILQTYNADSSTAARVQISLDDLYGTASLLPLESIHTLFKGDRHWAAYVAGAYYILAKYRHLTPRALGANIACYSTVPLGGGVSSSAALEVATLSALTSAYHLLLEPLETAVLAQRIENQIVGAPCGVMDQVTSMCGKSGQLLRLRCQPHTIEGFVNIPPGLMVAGINSNVKHSVGGSAYRNTRIAAFMAQAIITHIMAAPTDPTNGYLANITPADYRSRFRSQIPTSLTGQDFITRYGATIDRVTTIDPAVTYTPRAAADHHVFENARVHAFVDALAQPTMPNLIRAGRLMLASHASYSHRAHMGCTETDLLVRLVMNPQNAGPRHGFYGAKITGGGSGGTVAILCTDTPATRDRLNSIAAQYQQTTGLVPLLLLGTSPGAADSPVSKMTLAQLRQQVPA